MSLEKCRKEIGLNTFELSKRLKSIYKDTDLTSDKIKKIENNETKGTKENNQDLSEFFNTSKKNI
ncbi:hypothetical protein [Staphylococcus gallinarum]|uniref:hypothetical protein n=1 Tax=Staphylococcus gallinarum TaxID=1293 RepID=UPI002440EEF9|nr:hypothetical protein [Staphylococcus gallinarum]